VIIEMFLLISPGAEIAIFYIVLFFVMIFLLILGKASIKIVRQTEVIILEHFGKYRTTLKPGLHTIWPFIQTPRKIHWRYVEKIPLSDQTRVVTVYTDRIQLREHVIDFGRQHVITKDTVQIHIDALVYYQIKDPELAVFAVENLPDAIELLTQTTLRNVIAQMTLDDTFSSRELINSMLKEMTEQDAERWGVRITHVEIMNIIPPSDTKNAMELQIKEERERRSLVLTADGGRESAIIRSKGDAAQIILRAEAQKTADIQRAKGRSKAKLLIAQAEAKSIELIKKALEQCGCTERATDYLIAMKYLRSLRQLSANKNNSKIVMVPCESIKGIGQLFSQQKLTEQKSLFSF